MRFVELYLDRGDLKMVRSNIRSLKPDMVTIIAVLALLTLRLVFG